MHITRLERKAQVRCLKHHSSQRPYIALLSVWLILPYLRARVVWSASLCVHKSLIRNFGDVKIAQLHSAILKNKHICALITILLCPCVIFYSSVTHIGHWGIGLGYSTDRFTWTMSFTFYAASAFRASRLNPRITSQFTTHFT